MDPKRGQAPNSTNIVHLGVMCSNCPPCPEALCGAEIRGVEAPEEILDCPVCFEMAHKPRRCVSCGILLEGW